MIRIESLPVAWPGRVCKRGLHVAPWMGEQGEIVLLAFKSNRRLAAPPLELPWGADSVSMAEALQATLDEKDPPLMRLI